MKLIILWLYCLAYMALADRTVTLSWDGKEQSYTTTQ